MRKAKQALQQSGFTLIELLIAVALMAVMAGLGWRGLDGLVRSREVNQSRVDATAVLQTVLAQWRSDLDHLALVPGINDAGLAWDGQTLRITRRASTPLANGSDAGLWVVAWTRRDGRWWRWQSNALRDRTLLLAAWGRAERWGKNASAEDQNFETPLVAIDQWQINYFRANAWTNALSSSGVLPSAGNTTPISAAPDAVRLVIQLNPERNASAPKGRITLDWVRPNFSNSKT